MIFLVAGCAGLSDAQQLTGTDAVGGTAVGSPSGSAVATEATGLKPAQPAKILIEYVPPMDPKHEAIYKWIKEHELLELMQMVLSPFRLSFSVTLRFKGCNGVRNAYYDPEGHTVDVCYEYLQDIVDKAPATTTSGGVTREDAIMGPTVEVFLHESAHMLFRQYNMPLLGNEEDSADAVAAYAMMQFGPKFARKAIGGVTVMNARKAAEQAKDFDKNKNYYMAASHPLAQTRYYTLLCFAYGGDPKTFADVVEKGYLPKWRAESCYFDYARIKHAVETLFQPHIDTAKAKQVHAYFEQKY